VFSQQAAAQPPEFPDLGGFSPAPAENYFESRNGVPRKVNFSTPYNVECYFDAEEQPPPGQLSQGATCTGDLPGIGGTNRPESGGCMVPFVGPINRSMPGRYAVQRFPGQCDGTFSRGNLLNVGQKVSYRNATCAVGADQLIACLDTTDGEHGFALKPSGSLMF
jgi:hypothetical protein